MFFPIQLLLSPGVFLPGRSGTKIEGVESIRRKIVPSYANSPPISTAESATRSPRKVLDEGPKFSVSCLTSCIQYAVYISDKEVPRLARQGAVNGKEVHREEREEAVDD